MDLNKRHLEILNYLLDAAKYVKYDELCEKYKVSQRTIRYDIDKINDYLSKYSLTQIIKKRDEGIGIVDKEKLSNHLNKFYQIDKNANYYYSREERRNLMAVKLLESNEPLSIKYFQDYFSLSKNTILKELDKIEELFKKNGIKLIRKPKIGIYVEGKEINKRRAIIDLTFESVKTEDLFHYVNRKFTQNKINNIKFDILFSEFDIDFLNSLIRMAETELQKSFTDEGYGNLITHISLMIKRLQLNKEIILPDTGAEGIHFSKEYKIAEKMVRKVEKKFEIKVPRDEIKYIAIHLLGTKILKSNDVINDELFEVTTKMVEEIEDIYKIDFDKSKNIVISNLILHLRPTVYRIKYGMKLQNPMFNNIYKNYRTLFFNTKLACRHLEKYMNTEINDQEISYITLHFGAALEKAKKRTKEIPKLILVCATGIGTAQMLASQISTRFDCEILKTISSRKIEEIKDIKYDYLISTVTIPNLKKSSYLKINAMLLRKDYEILEKYLRPKYKEKNKEEEVVKKLIKATEKYTSIKDREQLAYEFLYVLKNNNEKMMKEEKVYMLEDLLFREVIKLNVSVKDWKEAIGKGSEILINRGDIKQSYVDCIFKNFEKMGPYMVVAPGIVLAHARPEDGVNKLSMSLITLKDPVEFGSDLNDPVKLVVTLAASDNTSHLKALSQLMNLFMDSDDLNKIMTTNDKNEVLKITKAHSQN
ncbi:BglG family transcription antiterminator [Abyssisolibacter fermentans]|uniref:BglG family transcription antiterminator n=1 Tax=Abyssisolibacter fermentans TaxID=1766203 RepID=UPI00082C4C1A|nr:BglG family transcription antiterminator [Abyssisolibacter fermentans]